MLDIRVNRDAMARLGVTAQDVQDTVTATIGGRTSGQIFEGDRRFPVVIRLSEAQRADIGLLQQVQVPVAGGGYVPLSSVAEIKVVDGPNQISRENGKGRVGGSEEHTAELQSLMRLSYAVFCLKNKNEQSNT